MGGNCRSTRSLPIPPATRVEHTPKPSQKDPIQPNQPEGDTDSLHSDISDSSGISTGSSASGYSNGSGSSGTSSGYYSSGGSPPPPPPTPTDFAGLPNMGSTCYMNAVLQIIAALYKDEARGGCLKELINKINTTYKPLNGKDINNFREGLPTAACDMAKSPQQHDPSEFIDHIKEHFLCSGDQPKDIVYPIQSTESLFLKVKDNQESQEVIYRYNKNNETSYMLALPIVDCSLSEIIEDYQEKCVQKEQGLDIDWNSISPCKEDDLPSFVRNKQQNIHPVSKGAGKGVEKDYIKQIVLDLPDKLYIKLDRNPNESKVAASVHRTMEITIKPDPNKKEDTVQFDLHGFILHGGSDTQSGHYIAYVKRAGNWYEANDSSITERSASDAERESQQAYLLFYRKK